MTLNVPETRQRALEQRLNRGDQVVAAEFADEFQISVDTVRRDILALESAGKAQRVRGGAVPVARPSGPLQDRLETPASELDSLARCAAKLLEPSSTIFLDGGSTVLAVARQLSPRPGGLVITASPWIAIACQENGLEVFMLGGRLSAQGGVNVGDAALARVENLTADVAMLGACGLDPEFGLSSDDFDESNLKRAMSDAATRTIVVSSKSKVGRRARHRTLGTTQIDVIVTDADPKQIDGFETAGVSVESV